jgi:ATP-dependent Lon protease
MKPSLSLLEKYTGKNMFDEKKIDDHDKTIVIPLLPLRDVVMFPHMIVPLFVGREKSIAALELAMQY